MIGLILDTSHAEIVLALTKKGKTLDCFHFPHAQKISTHLVPSLEALLTQNGLSSKDLSYIAIGIGPGSYTGTRVGVAVAKTLSFALQLPLIPFCSLLCFVPEQVEGLFAFAKDSKLDGAFVLKAFATPIGYHSIRERFIPKEELPLFLKDIKITLTETTQIMALPRLFSHLFTEFSKNQFLLSTDLQKLDLLYFHQLPLPEIPVEVLPT